LGSWGCAGSSLTERLDRLTQRFEGLTSAIGSHQEALRLIFQQNNEWREQMRIIQTEIRDMAVPQQPTPKPWQRRRAKLKWNSKNLEKS